MVTLQIYKDDVVDGNNNPYPSFEIQFYNRVNIVLGDSGEGKSFFFSRLRLAINKSEPWSYKCIDSNGKAISIIMVDTITVFEQTLRESNGSVVVIDEDTVQALRSEKILDSITKSNNYFILLDRNNKVKLSVNVKSIYEVKETRLNGERILRFIPSIKLYTQDITAETSKNITHIITEDTKSGKIFWENILGKLSLIECKNPGNGGMEDAIESTLRDTSGEILIALDYDRGARTINDIIESDKIDKTRIHFIPLESFEEVICNSEFVLSKFPELYDKVINYKLYIDASIKSTGYYFSTLLFRYVKQKPPIEIKGKRNVEQFYRKGIEYFKQCFIDDCCGFSSDSCKLHYDGSKKEAMLANKFEEYRIFI